MEQLVPSLVSKQPPSSFAGVGVGGRSRGEVPNGLESAGNDLGKVKAQQDLSTES